MQEGVSMIYNITPVSKPRQTQSDKWRKRPCVVRYHAFADQVRAEHVDVEPGDSILFVLPMPVSWSKKKKDKLCGQPHKQTPDLDNLLKAIFDATHDDDSHIYKITAEKRWGDVGSIRIDRQLKITMPKKDAASTLTVFPLKPNLDPVEGFFG